MQWKRQRKLKKSMRNKSKLGVLGESGLGGQLQIFLRTRSQRLSTTRWKEIWQEDPVQVQEVPVEDFEESRNAVLHLGGLPLQLKVGSLSGWGAAAIIHQLIH